MWESHLFFSVTFPSPEGSDAFCRFPQGVISTAGVRFDRGALRPADWLLLRLAAAGAGSG
jgi:hypothetical protein